MKTPIEPVDAKPSKRLFLSIIADYDLDKSICELVDNALDVWVRNSKSRKISVKIFLDKGQQTIRVEDNAGGVAKSDLHFIVGPGQTGTTPTQETIGIFGVGTKRAVVALAQDIRITTRHNGEKTFEVDFDDRWLADDDDWFLPAYMVDDIPKRMTIVQLQRLRLQITDEAISQLRDHLGATYAQFLRDDSVEILLNRDRVVPRFFDNWAYPPKYQPRHYAGELQTEEGGIVKLDALPD